jgi:hypothetical protein
MIPLQIIKQVQLSLPFQPSVTTSMTDSERDQLMRVLAQLLLAAADIKLEVEANEH